MCLHHCQTDQKQNTVQVSSYTINSISSLFRSFSSCALFTLNKHHQKTHQNYSNYYWALIIFHFSFHTQKRPLYTIKSRCPKQHKNHRPIVPALHLMLQNQNAHQLLKEHKINVCDQRWQRNQVTHPLPFQISLFQKPIYRPQGKWSNSHWETIIGIQRKSCSEMWRMLIFLYIYMRSWFNSVKTRLHSGSWRFKQPLLFRSSDASACRTWLTHCLTDLRWSVTHLLDNFSRMWDHEMTMKLWLHMRLMWERVACWDFMWCTDSE